MATAPNEPARWKVGLLYGLFGLVAFVCALYLTFPYGRVRERLEAEGAAQGWKVQLGSLGPGFFGVTARNVRISRAQPGPAIEGLPPPGDPQPLVLDAVSARPSLFPLGLALRANAFGGQISGAVGGRGALDVRLSLRRLDPSKGNLEAFSGLKLTGALDGSARLSIPRSKGALQLQETSGLISLDGSELILEGGSVVVPMYGQPTPVDLPRIVLGALTAQLDLEEGLSTLRAFQVRGEDLELDVEGTLKLAQRLDYSETHATLRLKATPEFVRRLGMIGGGLALLPSDPKDPDVRLAKVTGFIGRPNFVPGR